MASRLAQLLPHVHPEIARDAHEAERSGVSPDALAADVLIANPRPLPEAALRLFDSPPSRHVDAAADPAALVLVDGGHRIVLWRGDITTLKVDAIVNAANEAGLG